MPTRPGSWRWGSRGRTWGSLLSAMRGQWQGNARKGGTRSVRRGVPTVRGVLVFRWAGSASPAQFRGIESRGRVVTSSVVSGRHVDIPPHAHVREPAIGPAHGTTCRPAIAHGHVRRPVSGQPGRLKARDAAGGRAGLRRGSRRPPRKRALWSHGRRTRDAAPWISSGSGPRAPAARWTCGRARRRLRGVRRPAGGVLRLVRDPVHVASDLWGGRGSLWDVAHHLVGGRGLLRPAPGTAGRPGLPPVGAGVDTARAGNRNVPARSSRLVPRHGTSAVGPLRPARR